MSINKLALAFVGLLVLTTGCHKSRSRPKIYEGEVHGRVTLGGKPLPGGTVTFVPEIGEHQGGRPGLAKIEEDGRYWVGNSNLDEPSGLKPGAYKVTVLLMTPNPTGTGKPIAALAIPDVYTLDSTTPLSARIVAGSNPLDFDLTSNPAPAVAAKPRLASTTR